MVHSTLPGDAARLADSFRTQSSPQWGGRWRSQSAGRCRPNDGRVTILVCGPPVESNVSSTGTGPVERQSARKEEGGGKGEGGRGCEGDGSETLNSNLPPPSSPLSPRSLPPTAALPPYPAATGAAPSNTRSCSGSSPWRMAIVCDRHGAVADEDLVGLGVAAAGRGRPAWAGCRGCRPPSSASAGRRPGADRVADHAPQHLQVVLDHVVLQAARTSCTAGPSATIVEA